jgi:alkylation response protein AidB-like acyl-CoA dehydrogenase
VIDERRTIPPYVALDFGNHGLMGMQVEERFGGLALRNRDLARVLEQAAAIDLAVGTWILICLFPGIRPIAAFGGEALRAELLPALAAGRVLAGYGQTEPGAGTHFHALATTARPAGPGRFRISGDKTWIGNAGWSGVLTVMAQELDEDGRRKGLSAFAVRTERAGVAFGAELLSMGMRGVIQSEVHFRDVLVDEADRIGARARGVDVGVDSMSWSRFAIAATCIGAMKRCVQMATRFAGRRPIATGRVLEHPVVRVALAESLAEIAAAESVLYRVADDLDAGRGVSPERFALCKLVASEFASSTADRTVQILASRGYDEENLAPQYLRDARVTRIFEGTSEALLAFLGAAALTARSDVYTHLREELGAAGVADALAEASAALKARRGEDGEELPRPWQCARAGWAAAWALLAASLARDASAAPSAEAQRRVQWAAGRLEAALDACQEASLEERVLLGAPVEKSVAALADGIGEPEQAMPGGRLGLDPLLRREAPPSEDDR